MRNFFIIGGQRCGTTWLYKMLDSHPEINMAKPIKPEPKYFLNNTNACKKKYLKYYFNGVGSGIVLGEKSTSYYESEQAARAIKSCLPESKIIFVVRNPIERAISNYKFSKINGLESRSLEDVFLNRVENNKVIPNTSVNPFDYIKRGMYSNFIGKYLDIFGGDKIHVACFEKIVHSTEEFRRLLRFLEVNDAFLPSLFSEVVNSTSLSSNVSSDIRSRLRECYEEEVLKMKKYIDISYWQEFIE